MTLITRKRLRYYPPAHLATALLAVEGLLLLSEHFRLFAFNGHRGYAVVIAAGAAVATLVLTLAWLAISLVLQRRLKCGVRRLFLLVAAVAIPSGLLATEMQRAKKLRKAEEAVGAIGWCITYDSQAAGWLRNLFGAQFFAGGLPNISSPRFTSVILPPQFMPTSSEARDANAALEQLAELPELRGLHFALNLNSHAVTDAGIDHITRLVDLDALYLGDTAVTDAGLEHVSKLAQLQTLHLGGTRVTDTGLEHLERLTQLSTLNLSDTRVTDAGLEHLKGLVRLRTLYLTGTPVTDAGLEHLVGLARLQHLELTRTRVTDTGLGHLKGLTQIKVLYLYGTGVTDAGLQHLMALKQLQHLQIGQTRVTDNGVAAMRRALPNCQIRR